MRAVAGELSAAEQALAAAQREYRELVAQLRPLLPTLPAALSMAQAGTAEAATAATQAGAETQGAARELDLTQDMLNQARDRIRRGDLAGAIDKLQRIAQDAADLAAALPGEWGAAEWAAAEARNAIALLSRVNATRQHYDPAHGPWLWEDLAFRRLEALLATLPAETPTRAAQAIEAQAREVQALVASIAETAGDAVAVGDDLHGVADPDLRHQLGRLIGSNVPEQVWGDLRGLAERGEITAEELRKLIGVGRWDGHAVPAGEIAGFNNKHKLGWTPGTRKTFRMALRELPDEPAAQPAATPDNAAFALEAILLEAMGGERRRPVADLVADLPWWMPESWRDAVVARIRAGAVPGFAYEERTVSGQPADRIKRTGPDAEQPDRPSTGNGWFRVAVVTAAAGALLGGPLAVLGAVTAAAPAGGAAVAAVVAAVIGAYRYVRLGRGPPLVVTTLVGTFAVLTAGLMVGVGPSVVAIAMGGAVIGSGLVGLLPAAAAVVQRRAELVFGLAADAALAGNGGPFGRAAGRVRVWRDLARDLAAARAAVAAARQRAVDAHELVVGYRAELDATLREGIRWVLNPPDGSVRGLRYRLVVATVLGVPLALVESIAFDPAISVDTPPAIGGHADRFQSFVTDLGLVRAAVQGRRLALEAAEQQEQEAVAAASAASAGLPAALDSAGQRAKDRFAAIGGRAANKAVGRVDGRVAAATGGGAGGGTTPTALGVPAGGSEGTELAEAGAGRPVTSSQARRAREANPIRGPPSLQALGRFGAGRALRKALLGKTGLRQRLADANTRLLEVLQQNRGLREQYEQQAGGLRAFAAGTAAAVPDELGERLAQSNRDLAAALAERRDAEAALAAALADAVRRASAAGDPALGAADRHRARRRHDLDADRPVARRPRAVPPRRRAEHAADALVQPGSRVRAARRRPGDRRLAARAARRRGPLLRDDRRERRGHAGRAQPDDALRPVRRALPPERLRPLPPAEGGHPDALAAGGRAPGRGDVPLHPAARQGLRPAGRDVLLPGQHRAERRDVEPDALPAALERLAAHVGRLLRRPADSRGAGAVATGPVARGRRDDRGPHGHPGRPRLPAAVHPPQPGPRRDDRGDDDRQGGGHPAAGRPGRAHDQPAVARPGGPAGHRGRAAAHRDLGGPARRRPPPGAAAGDGGRRRRARPGAAAAGPAGACGRDPVGAGHGGTRRRGPFAAPGVRVASSRRLQPAPARAACTRCRSRAT